MTSPSRDYPYRSFEISYIVNARKIAQRSVSKPEKDARTSRTSFDEAILELRRLHIELDTAVLNAYGWSDLDLGHTFVEVETLPENDRTRYTITPAARKELLTCLLTENHKRAAEEKVRVPHATKTPRGKAKSASSQIALNFG